MFPSIFVRLLLFYTLAPEHTNGQSSSLPQPIMPSPTNNPASVIERTLLHVYLNMTQGLGEAVTVLPNECFQFTTLLWVYLLYLLAGAR
jgi:hypothetical protein